MWADSISVASSNQDQASLKSGMFRQCKDLTLSQPSFFVMAAWFGMVAGFVEVGIRGVQKVFFHEFINLSPHVVWMAPAADVCLFSLIGLGLWFLGKWWPSVKSLFVSGFVLGFLVFWGPLSAYPRLHFVAALLLALGLAFQTARLLSSYADRFRTLVLKTGLWMGVMALGTGIGVPTYAFLSEGPTLMASPFSNAPNVLMIVLDTVRAKNLSLYGYERSTTPNLEKFANKGVVFDRALSTSPWTLPSHGSLFTSRFPFEQTSNWRMALDDTYPTLAEMLKDRGYFTAGFVANLLYCTYESGLDRGFDHYEDYPISVGMVLNSSWLVRDLVQSVRSLIGLPSSIVRKSAEDVNAAFFNWLARVNGRPFFAFVNYFDAHTPYLPPEPFSQQFSSSSPDVSVLDEWPSTPEEIQMWVDAYDGALAYLDHQVGILLDKLEKQGILEKTVVIITSDHGEQFGEHGLFDHANSLYLPVLHVPLLISYPPQVPAGQRISVPITLADLPATVFDLLDLENIWNVPQHSLARFWSDSAPHGTGARPVLSEVRKAINMSEWFPVMKGDMKSLVMGDYHYIQNGDGQEELYNWNTDEKETQDLATSQMGKQRIQLFRKKMKSLRGGTEREL